MKPTTTRFTPETVNRIAESVKLTLDDLSGDAKPLGAPEIVLDPKSGVVLVTIDEPAPPITRLRKDIDPEVARELIELSVLDAFCPGEDED